MNRTRTACVMTLWCCALIFACETQTPSRDHIPILQQRLFRLQEAIKTRDRSAIDSLLSVQILTNDQSSDSLLKYIYGPTGDFAFSQLGRYRVFYTEAKARIDCYVMDSSMTTDRPLTLTFVLEHDMWLLKRFEPGLADPQADD
jgi:hypothetical protein